MLSIQPITGIPPDRNISINDSLSLLRVSDSLNAAVTAVTLSFALTTMICFGLTLNIRKVKTHLSNPKGAAIALLAQFCIMPLAAFFLAKTFRMEPMKAIAVLICGCCPGGTLSNVFSLLLEGDLNLSIVVTTISNICALGTLPLLLFIVSHGFGGLKGLVPYGGITFGLFLILMPCFVGIAINRYIPTYSQILKKMCKYLLGILAIATIIILIVAVKDSIWMIFMWDTVSVAALLPLTGFTLGYALSLMCRLDHRACRTISMETGCQNSTLCATILNLNFPLHVIGPMVLFPLLFLTFQSIEALLAVMCFKCRKRYERQDIETSYPFSDTSLEYP